MSHPLIVESKTNLMRVREFSAYDLSDLLSDDCKCCHARNHCGGATRATIGCMNAWRSWLEEMYKDDMPDGDI